jgi:hypothetical protein
MSESKWGRERNFIWKLMHAGFHRGVELHKNAVSISVHFDASVPETDREHVMSTILAALEKADN